MAIVVNKALAGAPNPGSTTNVDNPYQTANRFLANSPQGATTPLYRGELVHDATGALLWKAIGMSNTHWVAISSKVV